MLYLLVVLGLLADSVTFLMLPPGAEANPVVASLPVWMAIVARTSATGLLILSSINLPRPWRELMLGIAIAAGFLGAGSNLSVLL